MSRTMTAPLRPKSLAAAWVGGAAVQLSNSMGSRVQNLLAKLHDARLITDDAKKRAVMNQTVKELTETMHTLSGAAMCLTLRRNCWSEAWFAKRCHFSARASGTQAATCRHRALLAVDGVAGECVGMGLSLLRSKWRSAHSMLRRLRDTPRTGGPSWRRRVTARVASAVAAVATSLCLARALRPRSGGRRTGVEHVGMNHTHMMGKKRGLLVSVCRC